MKKVIYFCMILLFTVSSFAENQIVYDVGVDKIQVMDDSGITSNLVATVNLETASVDNLDLNYEVTAQKIPHYQSNSYFIAINTKSNSCQFLYCTNIINNDQITYKPDRNHNSRTFLKLISGAGSGGLPELS